MTRGIDKIRIGASFKKPAYYYHSRTYNLNRCWSICWLRGCTCCLCVQVHPAAVTGWRSNGPHSQQNEANRNTSTHDSDTAKNNGCNRNGVHFKCLGRRSRIIFSKRACPQRLKRARVCPRNLLARVGLVVGDGVRFAS